MKHLYAVLLLSAVAAAALLGYRWVSRPGAAPDAALVVNGQVISRPEFDRRYRASPFYPADPRGFADHAVTQALLIQEARRLGLDQDEAFRASLQNFYEQSLVKSLMDRQYRSPAPDADDAEVARYLALAGRTVRFTVLGPAAGQEAPRSARFEELGGPVRLRLAALAPGERTEPFRVSEETVSIRFDGLEGPPPDAAPDPARARRMVVNDRREQAVDDWLWGLRSAARIELRVP
ncbi:MAG: SurA N-terminal domain-containing protein [Deferrisomatales bacterium]